MTTMRLGWLGLLLGASNAMALPITGVVTADGGAAIESATVRIWAEDADAPPIPDALAGEVQTDQGGRFAVAELPAGVYRVAIEAEGFVPHDIAELSVPKDGAVPTIRVALAAAVFIAGVVANAGGEAAADAVVETQRPGGRTLQAHTDAKGRFRLGPLAAGDAVYIDAHTVDGGRVLQWPAVAPRDDVYIRVRGGGVLRGRVVDRETGLPLNDFRVTIAGFDGDENIREIREKKFRWTDGVFTWGSAAGRLAATVSADGYQLHTEPDFEMPQDGTDVELNIALHPGAIVRGRVVDATTGLPVAEALVTAKEGALVSHEPVWYLPSRAPIADVNAEKPFGIASDRTDAEGAFVLRQLPRETVTVYVRAEGYLAATAVAQPDDAISVELSRGATVRGWLVDQEGLRTDGVVSLWYPLSSGLRSAAATAASGFAFEQVPSGRYRLWGRAAARADRWPFDVDEAGVAIVVSPEDGVIETEVALIGSEGCDVTGTVGGLLAGESARVEFTQLNRAGRRVGGVDEAGRFALSVRPGAARVQVRTSAERILTQRVDDPCVARDGLHFRFDGRWRLYGTVTGQDEPARVTLHVESRASSEECGFETRQTTQAESPRDCPPMLSAAATTSPSGQYTIRGLPSGTYELWVFGTGHRREVRVASDTRADVHVRDDEGQVSFDGVVTHADSRRPLARVYVLLRQPATGLHPTFTSAGYTNANGVFRRRVTPGTYRIFVSKTGFAPQWREVVISETTPQEAISLAPANGASVRFTDAETGQPLPFVTLTVDDQAMPLGLTKEGAAKLWDDLEGRDLLFRHHQYEDVTVPRWDGAALDVKMRGRRAADGADP